jgi:hypothetical protein
VTHNYDLIKQTTSQLTDQSMTFLKLKNGSMCASVWASAPVTTNKDKVDTFMISRALNPENRIIPWCGFND